MNFATPSEMNFNGSTNVSSNQLSPVAFKKYELKNTHAMPSGQIKSNGKITAKGVVKQIKYTAGVVWDNTPDPLQEYWFNTPTYQNYKKIKEIYPECEEGLNQLKFWLQSIYDNKSQLPEYLGNITTRMTEFIVGEMVGLFQSTWENIKEFFDPIVKVIQEIKAFVTNVINKFFEAIVYIVGMIAKIFMIIGFITPVLSFASIFVAITLTNKVTRKLDPTSKYYTLNIKKEGRK